MKLLRTAVVALGAALTGPALAAVPIIDGAQLDEHTQTSDTVIKLVPITTDRQKANQGVNCAVTTGKRANVTDPAVNPTTGRGTKAIQDYAPDTPSTPTAGATGGVLASQTLFKTSGDVTGNIEATQKTIAANTTTYHDLGMDVGSATTVMAAWDQNSAARVQNGLTWNATINALNQWVAGLNAQNLDQVSAVSRNTIAMQSGTSRAQTPPTTTVICSEGLVMNTNRRSASDPVCIAKRYIDNPASVSSFLGSLQRQTLDADPQPPLTDR